MEKRAVIYGAGGNCWTFLTAEGKSIPYSINYIVDKDEDKQGGQIDNIKIREVDSIRKNDFDILIIALQNWHEVARELRDEYKVSMSKMYVYDVWNDPRLQTYSEARINRAKRQVNLITDELGVFHELLLEAYNDKEFEDYSNIMIIGKREYVDYIEKWFDAVDSDRKVVEYHLSECETDCKYVFTDNDYQEKIIMMMEKGFLNRHNWLVLPFFDVKKSLEEHGAVSL